MSESMPDGSPDSAREGAGPHASEGEENPTEVFGAIQDPPQAGDRRSRSRTANDGGDADEEWERAFRSDSESDAHSGSERGPEPDPEPGPSARQTRGRVSRERTRVPGAVRGRAEVPGAVRGLPRRSLAPAGPPAPESEVDTSGPNDRVEAGDPAERAEAAHPQSSPPAEPDQGALAQPEVDEPGLAHPDATAVGTGHVEPEYAEPEYAEPEYAEPEYAEAGHAEAGYAEAGYAEAEGAESEAEDNESGAPADTAADTGSAATVHSEPATSTPTATPEGDPHRYDYADDEQDVVSDWFGPSADADDDRTMVIPRITDDGEQAAEPTPDTDDPGRSADGGAHDESAPHPDWEQFGDDEDAQGTADALAAYAPDSHGTDAEAAGSPPASESPEAAEPETVAPGVGGGDGDELASERTELIPVYRDGDRSGSAQETDGSDGGTDDQGSRSAGERDRTGAAAGAAGVVAAAGAAAAAAGSDRGTDTEARAASASQPATPAEGAPLPSRARKGRNRRGRPSDASGEATEVIAAYREDGPAGTAARPADQRRSSAPPAGAPTQARRRAPQPATPAAAATPAATSTTRPEGGPDRSEATPASGSGTRKRWLLVAALLLLAAISAAVALFFQSKAQDDDALASSDDNLAQVDKTGTDTLNSQVRDAIQAIFTYDSAQLDASEQRALSFIAPGSPYVDEFKNNFAQVRGYAPKVRISLKSTVAASGVERLTDSDGKVLLMVNQIGRQGVNGPPITAPVRLSVTAEKVGGTWKVAQVDPK